jgi:hypothetical protein
VRRGALLLALASLLVLAACGGSQKTSGSTSAASVKAALEARLQNKNLSYRWVVCLRTRRSFAGSPIFRCNVNFGEPRIVRYCAILDDRQLVTNYEQRELRCGRRATS